MDFRKASVAEVEVPAPVVVVVVGCVAACAIDIVLLIRLVGGDLTLVEAGVPGKRLPIGQVADDDEDIEAGRIGGVECTAGDLGGMEKVIL